MPDLSCPSCRTGTVKLRALDKGGDYCPSCGWSETTGNAHVANPTPNPDGSIVILLGSPNGFIALRGRSSPATDKPEKAKRYTQTGVAALVYGRGGYAGVSNHLLLRSDGYVSIPGAGNENHLTKPNWQLPTKRGTGAYWWLTPEFCAWALNLNPTRPVDAWILTDAEAKALACLLDHPAGVRASQVGMAVTGGLKANGTRLRAQGAGFIGAKMLSTLRAKGWARTDHGRNHDDYYHVLTPEGESILRRHRLVTMATEAPR